MSEGMPDQQRELVLQGVAVLTAWLQSQDDGMKFLSSHLSEPMRDARSIDEVVAIMGGTVMALINVSTALLDGFAHSSGMAQDQILQLLSRSVVSD